MGRIFHIFEEVKQLGVVGTLFRMYYELLIKVKLEKLFHYEIKIPDITTSLDEWRKQRKPAFFPDNITAKIHLQRNTNDKNQNFNNIAENSCGRGNSLNFCSI